MKKSLIVACFIIISSGLLLIGCTGTVSSSSTSTRTMPHPDSTFIFKAYEEELKHIPTRIYKGISPLDVYNCAQENLKKNSFLIQSADIDTGLIYALLEKGIVRTSLFWDWSQTYYVKFDTRPDLNQQQAVRFYHGFIVEEKSSGSDYPRKIQPDTSAKVMEHSLLDKIDQCVINKRGRL